jgi:sarcosine oxidase delta subunit
LDRIDYLSIDRSKLLLDEFETWKKTRMLEPGWFPIFSEFKDDNLLNELSGNAIKLYIYLGLNSKNFTGESWHSLKSISKYFDRSERTISNWLDELKKYKLVERIQPDRSSTAVTFLKPYYKKGRVDI